MQTLTTTMTTEEYTKATLRRTTSSFHSSSLMPSRPINPPSRTSSFVKPVRHNHPLVELTLPNAFICSGCKEYGAGQRFTCQYCNFEIHEFCARAPPFVDSHPLHPQHRLYLSISKPAAGGILRSKCDVCGKPTKGYTFHCTATSCNFQMHPSCSKLSTKMNLPTLHPTHPLILLPPPFSANATTPCGECNRVKRSGRVYVCTDPGCSFSVHAVCAKSYVNGLRAEGFKRFENERPSVLGAAAKIASHVVIGFIGGIMEGIGEGVGEAITQDLVGKGLPAHRTWNNK